MKVMMKVERREREELACEVKHQSPVPSWIPIHLGHGCSVCLWEFEDSDQVMAFTFANLQGVHFMHERCVSFPKEE